MASIKDFFNRNKKITIRSLNKFMKRKFDKLFPDFMYEGYGDVYSNQLDILYEIENYGIKDIDDLENIIPADYIDKVISLNIKSNYLGTLRTVMIINDYKKYIKNHNEFSYDDFWDITSIKHLKSIFDSYNISVDEIIKETHSNR